MTDQTTENTNTQDPAVGGDAGSGGAKAEGKEATTLLGGVTTDTKAAGETDTGDAGADGNTEGEDKEDGDAGPDDPKPEGAPENYELQVPDGFVLPEAIGSEFEAFARANNLTNEAANQALSLAVKHVENLQEAQQAAWREQVEGWGNEIRTDKQLGGDKLDASTVIAQKAIARFGTPELVDYLESSGLGNFPPLFRFCHQIGQRISEGGLISAAGAGEGRRSTAELFYPQP